MRRSTVALTVTATPSRGEVGEPGDPEAGPGHRLVGGDPATGESRATSIPVCTPTGSATSRTSDAGGVPVSTRPK